MDKKDPVATAYARRLSRISQQLDYMARLSREFLDVATTARLWRIQQATTKLMTDLDPDGCGFPPVPDSMQGRTDEDSERL